MAHVPTEVFVILYQTGLVRGVEEYAEDAVAMADEGERVFRYVPAEPSQDGGWVPKLVQLCDWLAGRGHADTALDILCNYNDPGNPGDGSCRTLHECLPPPPEVT